MSLLVIATLTWGVMVAPFDWNIGDLPRDPVPVDAIPDIGENQQIVFTQWMGRSPQDVEDQIGYPLTVALLGIPEVKTIRSYSMFGFSSIYIIFGENADFYWSRTRVLEKLNSLPGGTLPDGVQPTLGPDATALGQIYLYTLEGRDPDGNPTGGWDLRELRTIQDYYVRYSLTSAEGISEVASIGGFVQEYQIDVDPDAMRAAGVTLANVFESIRMSNVDVGARTIELNKVEYVIRGLGFIEQIEDIQNTVVKVSDNVPITVADVGNVSLGPALRRGALDKAGAEAVGGVAVVRYGYNPLAAIKNIKQRIKEVSPGLPTKVLVDYSTVSADEVDWYAEQHDLETITGATSSSDAWVKHLRCNAARRLAVVGHDQPGCRGAVLRPNRFDLRNARHTEHGVVRRNPGDDHRDPGDGGSLAKFVLDQRVVALGGLDVLHRDEDLWRRREHRCVVGDRDCDWDNGRHGDHSHRKHSQVLG